MKKMIVKRRTLLPEVLLMISIGLNGLCLVHFFKKLFKG